MSAAPGSTLGPPPVRPWPLSARDRLRPRPSMASATANVSQTPPASMLPPPPKKARERLMPMGAAVIDPAVAMASAGPPLARPVAQQPASTSEATRNKLPGKELALVELFLENIGKGKSSVADTGRTAKAVAAYTMARGGQPDDAITKLAEMTDQNGERKLHAWLQKAPWRRMLPNLYEFDMPKQLKGELAGEHTIMKHAAILPHELFASMYAHAPAVFEAILTGGSQNLKEWWAAEAALKSKWFQHHPAIPADRPMDVCIPVGMHGDDAGVQGQEKVTVLTWGSVAVAGPTLDTRLVFCMLKGSETVSHLSLDKVLKVMTWSFKALAEGQFPAEDEEGNAFNELHHPARAALAGQNLTARGHRGCWAEMRGDWKFLHESLHTQHYYSKNECCHLCDAIKKGPENRWYTNFAIGSDLRTSHVTTQGWKDAAMADPHAVSPLLHIPGFCIWRVYFDIMHSLDLGVLTHALPSALTELTATADVWNAGTRKDRLKLATQSYHQWCRTNNIASKAAYFGTRWCKLPYPEIGQCQAKAAAIRSMVYWFKEVCDAACHDLHGRIRATMMNGFVRADEIQRRSGRHLLPEAQFELAAAMEQALLAYNALAREAIAHNIKLWRIRPKHHAMTHIAYDHGGTNPRRVSCYQDEDMVGRMKRIYVMCHGKTAPYTSLLRYTILCGLRWRRVGDSDTAVEPPHRWRRPRSGWQRRSEPYKRKTAAAA